MVDVLFDELLEERRAIAVPDSSRRKMVLLRPAVASAKPWEFLGSAFRKSLQ